MQKQSLKTKITHLQPALASRTAMPCPIPLVPPTTTARLVRRDSSELARNAVARLAMREAGERSSATTTAAATAATATDENEKIVSKSAVLCTFLNLRFVLEVTVALQYG
jgi:hypothetical protein